MIYKTLHRKPKIEQHESHYTPGGAGPALNQLDQLGPTPTLRCSSTHNNTLQVLQRTAIGPHTSLGRPCRGELGCSKNV